MTETLVAVESSFEPAQASVGAADGSLPEEFVIGLTLSDRLV